MARGEREHEVTVEDRAGAVDGHDAIAVAVKGEADIRPVLEDRLLERRGRGGAAAKIDVRPVRCVEQRQHLRAGSREHGRRDPVRGAVRAIEDDAKAVELRRDRAEEVLVPLHETTDIADEPDPALRRPGQRLVIGHRLLDAILGRVGQLEAGVVEELDAVVWCGVVGRADDRAGNDVLGPGEVREARRRDMAGEQDVHADRAEPGRESALEHPAGAAGVAPDDHRVARTAEDVPGRPAQPQRELRRQVEVRDPADAIGAEEPGHGRARDAVIAL